MPSRVRVLGRAGRCYGIGLHGDTSRRPRVVRECCERLGLKNELNSAKALRTAGVLAYYKAIMPARTLHEESLAIQRQLAHKAALPPR
jgi:hypothetical protein